MVSRQLRGSWPQNVWPVSRDGTPLEAQLENEDAGAYHAYPMETDDPMWDVIVALWKTR